MSEKGCKYVRRVEKARSMDGKQLRITRARTTIKRSAELFGIYHRDSCGRQIKGFEAQRGIVGLLIPEELQIPGIHDAPRVGSCALYEKRNPRNAGRVVH